MGQARVSLIRTCCAPQKWLGGPILAINKGIITFQFIKLGFYSNSIRKRLMCSFYVFFYGP